MEIMNSGLKQNSRNHSNVSTLIVESDATNFNRNIEDVSFEFSFWHVEFEVSKGICNYTRPKMVLDLKKDTVKKTLYNISDN